MGESRLTAGVVLGAAALGWLLPVPGDADAAAGVTIAFSGPLVTTEAGGTTSFTIVLDEAPTAPVTISLASSNTAEGTVAPDHVVFSDLDWATPQTVTVTGVDDHVNDGDVIYSIVTGDAVSADPNWNGLSTPDVSITNRDDEDIVVSPLGPLTVLETGTTATFTVVLTSAPISDVVVTHASSDTTEGTVSPAQSTFTSLDWNVPQTITVTGVNDSIDDGDVDFRIDQSASSGDPGYDGFAVPSVAVTTLDDETPRVLFVPVGEQTTTEAGGTASYRVQLSSRPSTNVLLNLASADTTEGVPTVSQLTFNRTNWNVPQTVTVTGVDDAIDDGDITYAIHHSLTTTDLRYRNIVVDDVMLTNLDDDSAGVRFTPSSGLRAPEGGSGQFTVVLLSQPMAPVTVTHASSDTSQGTVSPSATTFGPSDWQVPQTVTITGVSDGVPDGEAIFFIEHLVHSDDPAYAALSIPRQRVRSADDGVGATTTTVAPTTTPSTTVAEPTTTSPTTTAPPTTEPASTTPTTTTSIAESASSAASTTTVLRTTSHLPRTGTDLRRPITAAACAVLAGLALQLLPRRRSPRA